MAEPEPDPDEEVTMHRFTGKSQRAGSSDPRVTIRPRDGSQYIALNAAAIQKTPLTANTYIDYYVADGGSHIGIKPVANGDVTQQSYKMTSRSASFGNLANALHIDIEEAWRCEAAWDDENDMLVVDITDVPRSPPPDPTDGMDVEVDE